MYLSDWSAADLFNRARDSIDDPSFLDASARCTTIEQMRETLDIFAATLDRTRRSRQRQARKREKQQRTFEVAGEPYEVGGAETYTDLFARLEDLPEPNGPRAQLDQFTPLKDLPPERSPQAGTKPGSQGKANQVSPKMGHAYDSPHAAPFVGVVGEMHAFRFLRSTFGIDERAWVSETRTQVRPLREDETDETSDSLGYDFRFAYEGETWCVEVKSTTADGTSFDLSPGQLDTASRIAAREDERWRILRVRRALTEEPAFDWLPNPFEPGVGQRLRLRGSSMTVEYTPANSRDN